MLRRTLTVISAVLLSITLVAWGASYWNWWFAGEKLVVWLQRGATEYTWNYLERFTPVPEPKYARFQPYRFQFAKTTDERKLAMLDGTIKPSSHGHHGYSGLQTTWSPVWRQRVPVTFHPKTVRHTIIPLWIPTLLLAILPACGFVSWTRRRWRSRHGLCVVCAYDLRGTAGACPECGCAVKSLEKGDCL